MTTSAHTTPTACCAPLHPRSRYRQHNGHDILRIAVGAMMLVHGYPKLLMLMGGAGSTWMDPIGIGGTLSLALSCFAEFFCSLALIFGLLTRLSAMVLAVNFWVVVFMVDGNTTWPQSELPVLYLVCYITLACTGAGHYSLDHLIRRKLDRRQPAECAACTGSCPPGGDN